MKRVSPCGAECDACEKYNKACLGCSEMKGKVFWLKFTGQESCPFFDCCVEKSALNNCGECKLFPCKLFLTGDPTKSAEENAEFLKKQIKALRG